MNNETLIKIRELENNEDIKNIVKIVGTPVYIYFQQMIKQQIEIFSDAINDKANKKNVEFKCCFAMLANHNPHLIYEILNEMEEKDLIPGVLCASEGHLKILSYISPLPRELNVIYSDVFLNENKLSQFFNNKFSSSKWNLFLILQTERQIDIFKKFIDENKLENLRVGIRIKLVSESPSKDIFSMYHGKNARFGFLGKNLKIALNKLKNSGISKIGFHIYPGTNILDLKTLETLYNELKRIIKNALNQNELKLDFIDVGGGFGIDYQNRQFMNPKKIIESLQVFSTLPQEKEKIVIFIEPGRTIIGPAGVLVTRVIDIKEENDIKFVVVDTGLSHFLRPYVYHQYHQVKVIKMSDMYSKSSEEWKNVFIVGSTMASGDFLAGNPLNSGIKIEKIEVGDLIAFLDVGAYGFCMSSNFSGLLKPPEVLVKDKEYYLIRERETVEHFLSEVPLCLKKLL